MSNIFENKVAPRGMKSTGPNKFHHNLSFDNASNRQKNSFSKTHNANNLTMNDFVDLMTNEGRTHGVFDQKNPALITAEAERWKEFNSYELDNHNIRTRDKIKNEINNMLQNSVSISSADMVVQQDKKMQDIDITVQ